MDKILKFSDETTNIVESINKKLLAEGRLSTDPDMLMFHSYDSYNIDKDETPIDSICRYTVGGLKHIFPLIKIELRNEDEIFVEDKLFEFSAIPTKNHIEYIKEVMIDIFCLYQNDETKIPKSMYKWYYKNVE
jgi:hypothetical protein